MVEVDFGPAEKLFKRFDLIEPVPSTKDLFDLLKSGRFGGPIDLRRLLTFEKVKGNLTNVYYSMETSNTDFYPHQFKPVLRFIESPSGRLLIADEVGLGKTIESLFIWKELQARSDARRLLIVCPAMLQEKWRDDLRQRFNIAAEIVKPAGLLEKLENFTTRHLNDVFVCICSLEGIRPPASFEDGENQSTRARLARLLDQNNVSDSFTLFDLVIVDEAHYLRNPSTASNRLARLLRDASRNLLLLTATPIQIDSDNLYQLLRLVDPDQFYDSNLFGSMLRANAPVVNALRALWRLPPDIETVGRSLKEAKRSQYFGNDPVLKRVGEHLDHLAEDKSKRVEAARLLESRSLLGHHMTRSRKREVLERKVERSAQVLNVIFSEREREIYETVTERIRERARGKKGASLFALIGRQRQMASSLVAALERWDEQGLLEEFIWEDLGQSISLDLEDSSELAETADDILGEGEETLLDKIDIKTLESEDSKYIELYNFISAQLEEHPHEKFVLFAYFRPTLSYLKRRLEEDGISTCLILGGMGDEKYEILREFQAKDGPSILLSSEIGSEGIDLQFCRFLINYDLPWNPMRVEQRIGRLDRLGQKAEKISIINFALTDTIEDRILLRLYDRIKLFEESIGDLEEILGEVTEDLLFELLNPELTDEQRDQRAQNAELAILNRRAEQNRLEREAVNLIGFSDFILDTIRDSREKGRWLSGDELLSFVDDFFARQFVGSKIERQENPPAAAKIRLSHEAKTSLGNFINESRPATRTRLHQSSKSISCLFDPRQVDRFNQRVELIQPTHPLIQWIRRQYSENERDLYPVAAIQLASEHAQTPSDDYVFVAHRWSCEGLRIEHQLAYQVVCLSDKKNLNESDSEMLIVRAARHGQPFPNAINLIGEVAPVIKTAVNCDEMLSEKFDVHIEDFVAENKLRCDQQEMSARSFADRRIKELKERLQKFMAQGSQRLIPMTEGLLKKERSALGEKLQRINQSREVDPTLVQLAAGIIRVS